MAVKSIEKIISPPAAHFVGDGFRVHNFVPDSSGLTMRKANPFIMMDYNAKVVFPPSTDPRGVGVHPHRGFETVTLVYKGRVAHHDSAGGGGVVGEGEVQWMTAAGGVLHKEYHERAWSEKGGEFHMVQLWVNLPARHKMDPPKYQALRSGDFGLFKSQDGKVTIQVVAGNYNGIQGAASTFTPIHMYNAQFEEGGKAMFSFPAHYTTLLLVLEGAIEVDKSHVEVDHLIWMKNDGEEFSIGASSDTKVLVFSGEPIEEPIAAKGPFVMNTSQEIEQAFLDFYQGKFGYLED